MMLVAIDPGKKGALAAMNIFDWKRVIILPFESNSRDDIIGFLSEIRGGEPYRRCKSVATALSKCKTIRSPHGIPYPDNYSENREARQKIQVLIDEADILDQTVECWIEEPSQIVPRVTDKKSGKVDVSKSLLMGATSSRKLGRDLGFWEGVMATLAIPCNRVPPKKWRGAFNVPSTSQGGNKKYLQNLAQKAFKYLTNEKGKSIIVQDAADSLLILAYAYMQYTRNQYIPPSFKELTNARPKARPTSTRRTPPSTRRTRRTR